eukprot:241760_1
MALFAQFLIIFHLVTHILNADKTYKGSIACGDIINGNTTYKGDIASYSFIINETNNSGIYVQFSSCGSQYDTFLYLFDEEWNEIISCDDCGKCNIGNRAQLNFPQKLMNDVYYVGIGGYLGRFGEYKLNVSCDTYHTFALNPPTYYMDNGSYIYKCDAEQCREGIILCIDDVDCHIECIGDYSCYDASISWPNSAIGSINCDGERACSTIVFPEPLQYHDFDFVCGQRSECFASVITCPQYSRCHIICSAPESCQDTIIKWSSQFVESRLTCNNTNGGGNGCGGFITQPPQYYVYHFNDTYSISTFEMVSNNTKITNEFEISFQIKINSSNNASYYSLLSIVDNNNNIQLMGLWMDYDEEKNV